MKINNIPVEQEIDRYVHGDLSEKEIEDLWSVLVREQKYMDYLETAADLKSLKQSANFKVAAPAYHWIYAAAAIILLLITVFAVVRLTNTFSEPKIEPIATIELPFQRSANTAAEITEHDKIIRDAILLYYADKFEEAVTMLRSELKTAKEPDWIVRLNITLGILYYNDDMFEIAKNYFATAVSYRGQAEPLKVEKAYWYLGNSWFQMLKFERAEKAMREVLEFDGAYSRVATMYLDAMEAAGYG